MRIDLFGRYHRRCGLGRGITRRLLGILTNGWQYWEFDKWQPSVKSDLLYFFYYFLGQHSLLALLKINLFLICEKIFNVYDNMIPKNFFRKRWLRTNHLSSIFLSRTCGKKFTNCNNPVFIDNYNPVEYLMNYLDMYFNNVDTFEVYIINYVYYYCCDVVFILMVIRLAT